MLLTEFDPSRNAVIDPDMVHKPAPDFPETVVSVFSHHLFQSILELLDGRIIAETHDVDGVWPTTAGVLHFTRPGWAHRPAPAALRM